jgi:MinD-like ATPase involved in chromosome partitioning or flagellar assembly
MDQAEKLRFLIKNQNKEKYSNKSFFFCSLTGGTGCTTLLYNIGKELSKELNVLIVEQNYLTPGLSNYLGLINNFDYEEIICNENYAKNIEKIEKNLDVFCVNMIMKNDLFDTLNNDLIKLEKYFSSKYNIILFDLGTSFFLYNYQSFFEKIFFVAFSRINDYNNLYRFFIANKNIEPKANVIINKYFKLYKIKEKFYNLQQKTKNINDVFFIKRDKYFEKLYDFNEIFIDSSIVKKNLKSVISIMKMKLIEGV